MAKGPKKPKERRAEVDALIASESYEKAVELLESIPAGRRTTGETLKLASCCFELGLGHSPEARMYNLE